MLIKTKGIESGVRGVSSSTLRRACANMKEEAKVLLLIAIGIAVVGICFWVFVVEPLGVLGALERLTPGIVYRVRTELPQVGLTLDDGPHPVFTPQVLDILQSHNAKATFFLIGERALRYPELVARIRAEGHEIGNHYFKNGPTFFHSDSEFVRNLLETEKAIELAEWPKLFRAPGGVAWPKQLRLAREYGYTCVLGCAYPHDPMRPPVWYMRWLIEKNLRPGTIVILHDGISDASKSVKVLPDVLEAGRRKELKFVSVEELMRAHGAAEGAEKARV
jgi:peptidoglycan/xylan/chitin deacetylase (PgdA/CDA1 family)